MTPLRCYFHPDYEYPLPEKHPFPMQKFRLSAQLLSASPLQDVLEVMAPDCIPDAQVERVHTSGYLNRLKLATLDEHHQKRIGLPMRKHSLYERSRLEVSGTVAAVRDAFSSGIGFNLAGGTHHAYPDSGSGYCVLNDVAVAICFLQSELATPDVQIMVIDTDAHQGNGTHKIFEQDPNVFTYDIHVGQNFPSHKERGSKDVALRRWVSGTEYMEKLEQTLPDCIDQFEPDFIFWISGADPHLCDRFGQMDLTTMEMDQRNQFVMQQIIKSTAPVAVLFGGGYHAYPDETGTLHARAVLQATAVFLQNQKMNSAVECLTRSLQHSRMQVIEKEVSRIGKKV
ncbi:MAG: histone deacetylase [Verrucomicrobiota bacterium]